jgi:hypothetical protein
MRTTRVLVLGVLAALTVTAFAGPGTASATTLCSVNLANCPVGNRYPEATVLVLGAEAPPEPSVVATTVSGEPFAVECEGVGAAGQLLVESGTPLTIALQFTTFATCTSGLGACTVEDLNAGYVGGLEAIGGGNGELLIEEGAGGGPPGIGFQCGALTCLYAAEAIESEFMGAVTAALAVNAAPLARQAGSGAACGLNATWTAEYEITGPPKFVSAAP